MSIGVGACRLPELNGVALGILEVCELPVGVVLRMRGNRYPGPAQLGHHRVQVAHAEVNGPVPAIQMVRAAPSWSKHGGACGLPPGRLVVRRRRRIDAEMVGVPRL